MRKFGFSYLKCATAGAEAVVARSGHSFARHTHDLFGFGAIHAGAQRWHSGRKQVEAGAGAAIAVNPGEVHDGEPAGGDERTWSMIYLDPGLVQRAAREIFPNSLGEFEVRRPVLDDPRIARAVRRLIAAETAPAEAIRREELLLALTALAGGFRSEGDKPCPRAIGLARSRIDDDPSARLSLAQLADLGGMSRFQLVRAFARATGLTPHAYLVQRRTDVARGLILRGTSLADASAAAGFSDQSHMTRIFVAKYGLSPGAYAKACRQAGRNFVLDASPTAIPASAAPLGRRR